MKKKWWIILIIVVVVLGILRFFWYKLRSYVRDTTICQQKHSSCAAILDTEYYYENHITCPICPTFWEYLIKGIKSLDINGVPDCCDRCRIKPMINQVLSHIGQTPFDIIDFCKKNGVVVEAYSPIAHGEAGRIVEVNAMAEKYGKSFAQICLKHQLQLGLVVLPKASSEGHLKDNFDLNFEISEDDMNILNGVKPLDNYGEHNFFPVFKHSGE